MGSFDQIQAAESWLIRLMLAELSRFAFGPNEQSSCGTILLLTPSMI